MGKTIEERLAEISGFDIEIINDSTSLREELGLDSIALLELLIELEEEYKFEIDHEVISILYNVNHIKTLIDIKDETKTVI